MSSPFSAAGLRTWHANISAFIAPTIVFFALSGILQIFNLHEAHGTYAPSPFVAEMAQVHKNQTVASERRDAPPAAGAAQQGPPRTKPPTPLRTTLVKWLFAGEALALTATTTFGIWIGLTHAKRKRTFASLLIAGTVVPLALLFL